jgi:hypothetical protein
MAKYKYYLVFKNDNVTLEIEEPFMFDAFSHSIERKKNGWAIDVHLFAENSELLFTNSAFSKTTQFEDIDGTILLNLSHGLKRIIDAYETYGPDAIIEFQIFFNDTLFTSCDLDLDEVDTDLLTFFKCGCIENNIRSKFKLREDDVVIDIYADKDLDGNSITPLAPLKVLLKSKPIQALSKWIKTDIPYAGAPGGVTNKFPAGSGYTYFNFAKNPILFGINDSLIPSPFVNSNPYNDTYDGTMKIIDAKSTKTNLHIKATQDMTVTHKWNGREGYIDSSGLNLIARVSYGTGFSDNTMYILWSVTFTGRITQSTVVPSVIDFDLPIPLREGEFLTLWWQHDYTDSTTALTSDYSAIDNYSHIICNDTQFEITANETTINSVIQGIRWIDLLKKSSEIISGLPVDAPRLDVGGEYYNTICVNGAGIRNIDSIPFNIKTKDAFETGMMVALDYQINEDVVRVGLYEDFFSDRLLRSFNIKPDNKFRWNTNKDYRIKTFDYLFRNYEQDRQEQSTLDAVHTQMQKLLPNPKTKATKKVQIEQILDVYKIDSLRRLGIDTETKDSSLSDDTTLAFISVTELPGSHLETHTGNFYINVTVGGIKIVSTNFRWDKIGLGLTSSFEILTGQNAGTYSITLIESSVLTLTAIVVPSRVTVSEIITFRYSLVGVSLISRTNEGFSNISGVISPNNYGNLIFSIQRNIISGWLPFLATCTMRMLGKIIPVSLFINNRNLITQLTTEANEVVDTADINTDTIAPLKKITDREFSVDIFLDNPTDIEDIFNEVTERNADGTIGGYFDFKTPNNKVVKGYAKKLDYIVKENKIEADCLEKYDDDYYNILLINRTSYSRYEIFGIYVTLYDNEGIEIFSSKRFNKIKIENIVYNNLFEFINDLQVYFS